MSEVPYVQANAGDPITAEWANSIQSKSRKELYQMIGELREELRQHRHRNPPGGDNPVDGLTLPREALEDAAVDEAKLADGAVTRAKLAEESVSREKLADGSVTRAKIGSNAVSTGKLAKGAVDGSKVDEDAELKVKSIDVTGDLTVEGTITNPRFGVTSVLNQETGELPKTGTFETHGGTAVIFVAGSGFIRGDKGRLGFDVSLGESVIGKCQCTTNEHTSHKATVPSVFVTKPAAGTHTLKLTAHPNTTTDQNDFFTAFVLELPF